MSQQDWEKLVHAFVFSRLDYCNGVFTGCLNNQSGKCSSFRMLLLRVLTKTRALHGSEPKYISNMILQYEPSRPLRSPGSGLLSVPRVRTKHGEAAFSFSAPQLWNKLPEDLRSAPTVTRIKNQDQNFSL
ncbi:hypothetical protein LDENG_00061870 [Lucifuga dentata]|nr:hypothetical protein LDENG_00061870 [Lucifuga dentata]